MCAPDELFVCVLSSKMHAVAANAQGNLVKILKVRAYSRKGVGPLGILVVGPVGAEETFDFGDFLQLKRLSYGL